MKNHLKIFVITLTCLILFCSNTVLAQASVWELSGNSGTTVISNTGTTDGTNFIGTTDNTPLEIMVSDTKAGWISGVSSLGNVALGYESQLNITPSSTNWYYNTSVGGKSLLNDTSSYNTALGYEALGYLSTGNYNVALGFRCLMSDAVTVNNNDPTNLNNVIGIGSNVDVSISGLPNGTPITNSIGIGSFIAPTQLITGSYQFDVDPSITNYNLGATWLTFNTGQFSVGTTNGERTRSIYTAYSNYGGIFVAGDLDGADGGSVFAVNDAYPLTLNGITFPDETLFWNKAGMQLNGVTYAWTSTAPATNQVLTSDVSGNLTWDYREPDQIVQPTNDGATVLLIVGYNIIDATNIVTAITFQLPNPAIDGQICEIKIPINFTDTFGDGDVTITWTNGTVADQNVFGENVDNRVNYIKLVYNAVNSLWY